MLNLARIDRSRLAIGPLLFALDWPFAECRTTGPPPDVQAALAEFWLGPENERVARAIGAPEDDWFSMTRCLRELDAGQIGRDVSPTRWVQLASSANERLAAEPMAAAVVGLHSMAILGSEGDIFEQIRDAQGLAMGCGRVVLEVVRALLAAEAIWVSMELAYAASEAILAQRYLTEDWEELLSGFRSALQTAEQRYQTELLELCESVKAVFAEDIHVRGAIAALAWNAGDVPHATALPGMETLPLSLAIDLLDEAFRRIPVDPYGQMIFLSLQDTSVQLRDYPVLHTVANNVFNSCPVHEVDRVMPEAPMPVRISRVYAETLRLEVVGLLTDEGRARFADVLNMGDLGVRNVAPVFYLRLISLAERLGIRSAGGIDGRDPRDYGTRVQRQMAVSATSDGYDRSSNLPLFGTGKELDPGPALCRLERLRSSARWFELTTVAPHPRGPEIAALAAREQPLLEELKALRLLQLLADLPRHYQYPRARAGEEEGYEPVEAVVDLRRAERRIGELISELTALWREENEATADYRNRRLDPVPTLAQFNSFLQPPS